MIYTATINQNGMVLLNKDARKSLGVKLGDKVIVEISTKSVKIERQMTDEEFFSKLDSMKSEKTKRLIKEQAEKSDDELLDTAMVKFLKEELTEGRL